MTSDSNTWIHLYQPHKTCFVKLWPPISLQILQNLHELVFPHLHMKIQIATEKNICTKTRRWTVSLWSCRKEWNLRKYHLQKRAALRGNQKNGSILKMFVVFAPHCLRLKLFWQKEKYKSNLFQIKSFFESFWFWVSSHVETTFLSSHEKRNTLFSQMKQFHICFFQVKIWYEHVCTLDNPWKWLGLFL